MGSDGWVCQEGVILSGLSHSWGLGLCWQNPMVLPWATLERRVTGIALSGGGDSDCWQGDGAAVMS